MPLLEQWLPIDLTADEFVAGQDVEHETFNDIYNRLLYLRRGRAFVDSQGFIEIPANALLQLRAGSRELRLTQGQQMAFGVFLVYVSDGTEIRLAGANLRHTSAAPRDRSVGINVNIWSPPPGTARLYGRTVRGSSAGPPAPLDLITFTPVAGRYDRFPPLVEL